MKTICNYRLQIEVLDNDIHPSIHCSKGSVPIGVQCHLHHRSPRALILRLLVECVDFFSTPSLDVVQPFSAWSSSPCLSPSFQASPPSPAYCPSSCICGQTSL